MKLVLLSGGSGKRLWPLSNDSRSKQFLKVIEDEDGNLKSMLQRVWSQLELAKLANSSVVATSKSQVEMIRSQIDEQVELIVEPSRRDTFPAIALAATYLYSVKDYNLNEVMTVLPVDPYVHNSFFEHIKELENVLEDSHADIALIGVQPTYPSSKYGYIVPKDKNPIYYSSVLQFSEKPTEESAKELIANGALWNCGVFGFKLGYIINILKENSLPVQYAELKKQYEKIPKISFDFAVVEKAKNIVVLPYSGYWKDLGTWNTLTEEMGSNQIGKGKICNESINTHLINELDVPITVLGVSNVVVAASPDGILVSEKNSSPKIKEMVGDFDNRPMYEERRWGWYRVLDHTKYQDGNEVLTKKIGIKEGKNLSYQFHQKRSEIWTIVKGEGIFVLNGELCVVGSGEVLEIKRGQHHAIKALTDMEIIEVQSGSELIEEDIVRLLLDWNEIEGHCYKLTDH
jgi:mannose-1-phosphate guanylyltransferase